MRLLSRARARFLGLFREVRESREAFEACDSARAAEYRKLLDSQHEVRRLEALLEEKQHALVIMTESRLNSDRTADACRGQIEAIREATEREIQSLKQTVDWMSLECGRRQVFGTAPYSAPPKEAEQPEPAGKMTARMLSRQLTDAFLKQAVERGQQPPSNGAEYSSTQRFSTESVAVSGGTD